MDLKLILKDGTEIQMADASLSQHYVVMCADKDAFHEIWDMLTEENISELQVMENGVITRTIVGSKLNGTQAVMNPDGITITGHFYMSGGAYIQQGDEYSEAGRILLGEEE